MKRLVLVFALAVVLYVPTIRYGFVQDDRGIIAANPAAHAVPAALAAFDQPYWPPETGGGLYRPVTILSYAVDWTVGGGRPGWLHVMNALLHGVASVLVVLVLGRWLPPLGAVAAGVVFASHPVHVEGVASLVSRAELLVAVLLLSAVLAARGRHWLLALLLAVGAMFSKEHGVIVGVAILLDDWLAPQPAKRYPALFYAMLFLASLGFLGAWFAIGRAAAGDMAPSFFGASPRERLALALPTVLRAAQLLVWPSDLSADYNPQVVPFNTGFSLGAVGGIAVVLGALWLAWLTRRRAPGITFAIILAALAYLPTSNLLFASGIVLAERTLYLPVIAVAAIAGALVVWLEAWRGPAFATTMLVLLGVTLAGRSWFRLPAWRDNRALLLTLLDEHPESYRAHASAAAVLAGTGDMAGARREYALADSIFPHDPQLTASRALLLLGQGDTSGARPLVARAAAKRPRTRLVLRARFLLAVARGDTTIARAAADTALRLRPWERSWYVTESQSVIRVLRPAG